MSFALDYLLSAFGGCGTAVSEARVEGVLVFGGNTLQYQDAACTGVGINNTSAVMQFFIGDEIVLNPQLTITAAAGNCCESGHSLANVLNRMSFFVDPLRSYFTYTSTTGSLYLSPSANPIPEPPTLVLFGIALAGLAAIRPRRKARAS